VFGVSSTSHWLSWFIVGITYSLISAFATPFAGKLA